MAEKISFVILSFNHPELTARCVRNALKLIQPDDLILFHNGSQERFILDLKHEFPQIEHRICKTNRGFAGGANAALRHGFDKSPWIFFLTNDTELLKIPNEVTLKEGLYAPLIWDRKKIRWDSLGGALQFSNAKLRHLRNDQDLLRKNEKFYVPGTAFLIHQSVFNELNGFDESFETFWEDVDFSLRCQEKSIPIGITKDFELSHLGGKTCHKNSHYTLYLYQRNRWKLIWKYVCKNKDWLSLIQLQWVYCFDYFRLNFILIRQKRWNDCRLLNRAFRICLSGK